MKMKPEHFEVLKQALDRANVKDPTTFSRFLGHRQIEVKPVSVYGKVVRGLTVVWQGAEHFPELLKSSFPDMATRRSTT